VVTGREPEISWLACASPAQVSRPGAGSATCVHPERSTFGCAIVSPGGNLWSVWGNGPEGVWAAGE
jgi:hypothetical protein